MDLSTFLIVGGVGLLVVGSIAALVVFWKRIMASRPIRVGLAVVMLPVILFCVFGFLASLEGSEALFVAFRIGYSCVGLFVVGVVGLLCFGPLRRLEANEVS